MKAWAIEMQGPEIRVICCVLAETQSEAFAEAFSEIEENIRLGKDNNYKDKRIKDFSPSMFTYIDIPNKLSDYGNTSASGFEEEIRRR